MEKRTVKFRVEKDGAYSLEAMEGFSGMSCVEKTKDIELVLGGQEISSGKKDTYYDSDPNPDFINIFND